MKIHFRMAHAGAAILVGLTVASSGQPSHAASPYDDYYNQYGHQPEEAAPVDNDAYYSAPAEGNPTSVPYTDNDAYYSAPGAYNSYVPPQGRSCNTIGDMPSCGGD